MEFITQKRIHKARMSEDFRDMGEVEATEIIDDDMPDEIEEVAVDED